MALNRARTQTESRKKIEKQLEELLQNFPSPTYIPILDDFHNNINRRFAKRTTVT